MQRTGLNMHISAAGSKKSHDQIHQMGWLGCPACVCVCVVVLHLVWIQAGPGGCRALKPVAAGGEG